MAEEIKARGESARWQSDCKPYRTHTVTVILESVNKEVFLIFLTSEW